MLAHPPRQLAALEFVLQHLQNSPSRPHKTKHWPAFALRLDREFDNLFSLFQDVYGQREDFNSQLAALIEQSFQSWKSRPEEMKALDLKHESDPHWFQSRKMLGGVCYVDLYAGNLNKIRAQIPYFKELGLTYLHLMPLFKAPEINSDGGYAVSSYREVNPSLGTMAQLRKLATELRQNGISLVIDLYSITPPMNMIGLKQRLRATKALKTITGYFQIVKCRTLMSATHEKSSPMITPVLLCNCPTVAGSGRLSIISSGI